MTMPDTALWQRLGPLFDEFVELPAALRDERLTALRASNPALARALEPLMDAHARAEAAGFLEGAVMPRADLEGASLHSFAGRSLGAYTLLAPLGRGGSGSAWRARRNDGRFEVEVALKLLHVSLVGRAQEERFRREGHILARLAHPHIARLLDAGIGEGGQPYLVLELVDGEPIDSWCDRRRLGVRARLELFEQVLTAVAHAHQQLVVHRDIKPANVLVCRDGGVKLLDFGIATILDDPAQAADAGTLTRESGPPLTPEYAAPEQWRGEPVGVAADVYALGVLLFRLLAGRHPTHPPGANAQQAMRATLEAEPARLGMASVPAEQLAELAAARSTTPARLARQLDADLVHIVARALRKEPSQRYPSIDAFAQDLRRHAAHKPVQARSGALAYRVGKFLHRHRLGVAAAATGGIALAVGVAGILWQARLANIERDRALRQFAQTEAVQDFMSFLVSSSSPHPFTMKQLLDRASVLADRQFTDDPAARARLLLSLARQYIEMDALEQARTLLLRARDAAAAAGDTDIGAQVECSLAAEPSFEPDAARAAAHFEAALGSARARAGGDIETLEYCHHARAERAFDTADNAQALADERAALALLGTPRAGNRALAIAMRANLAGALAKTGQTAPAIAELRTAIGELEAMGRDGTVITTTLNNNLGVLLARAGDPLQARAAFDRALASTTTEAENAPVQIVNRAREMIELGQPEAARRELDRALAAAAAQGDDRSPARAVVQFGWCAPGALTRCVDEIERARARLKTLLPPGHPSFALADISIARMALAHGATVQATEHLQRALAALPHDEPNRMRALTLLARARLQQGDATAALASARDAVAQARTALTGFSHSEWLGSALLAEGMAMRSLGQGDADAVLRESASQLEASVGPDAPATREARALLVRRQAAS